MNTSYKLLDEPDQGCAKGKILDSDEDHNLFAEFGLYYKAPPLAPPTPPFTLPADAQLTRLVPAPDDTDEAALNVAAAAAADPAAAIPATAPAATATATAVPATAPAATANEGLAGFAAIL